MLALVINADTDFPLFVKFYHDIDISTVKGDLCSAAKDDFDGRNLEDEDEVFECSWVCVKRVEVGMSINCPVVYKCMYDPAEKKFYMTC